MALYQKDEVSSPFPCFLTQVYKDNKAEAEADAAGTGGDFEHLIFALHAVLLESGFVALDSVTHNKIDGFRLPFTDLSFLYTIPDLVSNSSGDNTIETVSLKFHVLDEYLNVYGSLTHNPASIYRVCLYKPKFAPAISFACSYDGTDTSSVPPLMCISDILVKEISEFWKIVKDRLALPLLMDLSEITGLPSPPCFRSLLPELKLKVLEYLPGTNIGKVACVCSDLRGLSSTDDLWMRKISEELKQYTPRMHLDNWKLKYVDCLTRRRAGPRFKRTAPTPLPHRPARFWNRVDGGLNSGRLDGFLRSTGERQATLEDTMRGVQGLTEAQGSIDAFWENIKETYQKHKSSEEECG